MFCSFSHPFFLFPSFFFKATATTEIYTLSLHDALPILEPEVVTEPARLPVALRLVFTRSCAVAVDRKSTRLNSSHLGISYAVFCLKKKKKKKIECVEYIPCHNYTKRMCTHYIESQRHEK